MKEYLSVFLVALCFSVVIGWFLIPILRKFKLGQSILNYVTEHNYKSGTPTMGGIIFILATIISFFIFASGSKYLSLVCIAVGVSYMAVGFLDDFIKIKSRENEGLKPYQKIVFQLVVALISGFFALKNQLTTLYLPFIAKSVDLGLFIMPITVFVLVAITNSVNLTDGLDGLAGSVSVVYIVGILLIVIAESTLFKNNYYLVEEIPAIISVCAISIGAIIGFLCFNTNKASVFMGDTGSLALGGLLGTLTIFTGNTLFMPLIGIVFVISSLSVIIQVIYFKRTKKRIFLMAPFHHHLQHKGFTEGKISFLYSIFTAVIIAFLLIFY